MPGQPSSDFCADEALAALVAAAAEDDQAGLAQADVLLNQYPSDARLHFLRGSLLAGLRRYGDAHAAMMRSIQLAPDYDIARFQLGLLELSSGDATAAESTWAPLAKRAPDNALRLFSEGLGHLARDQFDQAISLLREGIACNQDNPAVNHDMQLVIAQVEQRINDGDTGEREVSAAHLLLQKYSGKPTKH